MHNPLKPFSNVLMRKKLVNFIGVCGWLVARNSLENTLFHQRPTTLLIATFHGFSMRPPTFPIWCASACRTQWHASSPAYTDFWFPLPLCFLPFWNRYSKLRVKNRETKTIEHPYNSPGKDFKLFVTSLTFLPKRRLTTRSKCFNKHVREIERIPLRYGV